MTSSISYSDLFNLSETSFIAGSDEELFFNVYSSGCTLVNLSGATIVWKLTRYNNTTTALLSKAGYLAGSPINRFSVKIDDTDTAGSSGKFIQIYSITDASGSVIKPGMGIINIAPFPS